MTTIGKSDQFQIVFSKLGVKAIYDPVSINALNLLSDSDRSLTELSKEIGTDSSALYFHIDKLIDEGAIRKIKDDTFSKNTKYRNTSATLIKSIDSEIPAEHFDKITVDMLIPESSDYDQKVTRTAVDKYINQMGIDFSPILENYGGVLAAIYEKELTGDRPEEMMYSIKSFVKNHNLCQMEVYSYNPLSIVIKIDEEEPVNVHPHISPCIGLIKQSMLKLGLDFMIKNIEVFGISKNMVRIDFTSSKIDEDETFYQSIEEDNNDIFALVSTKDNTLKIIDPDIQSRILFELEERPMCAIDMINKTGMPRSTVISNLTKLKDMGLIKAYSPNSAGYYALDCRMLIKKDRRSNLTIDDFDKVKEIVMKNSFELRKNSSEFILYTLERLGFNSEDLIFNIGSAIADELVESKDFDVIAAMKKLDSVHSGLEITINKIIPFSFSIVCDENDGYSMIKVQFYSGLISKLVSGKEYNKCAKTSSEERKDGKYTFTMELTPACLE